MKKLNLSAEEISKISQHAIECGIHDEYQEHVFCDYSEEESCFYVFVDDEFYSNHFDSLVSKKQVNTRVDLKIEGFLFEGVRCSANERDRAGILEVMSGLNAGIFENTCFLFSNGNSISLHLDNKDNFFKLYSQFRQSLFR